MNDHHPTPREEFADIFDGALNRPGDIAIEPPTPVVPRLPAPNRAQGTTGTGKPILPANPRREFAMLIAEALGQPPNG